MSASTLLPLETITHRILMLRGQKVLLDSDLAALYDVPTKRFNEQVKRNLERFPADFMFQLTEEEWESLRSQMATLKPGRGQHRKYMPYAYLHARVAVTRRGAAVDRRPANAELSARCIS